jgi:ketosteroid isomerase-like protein
MGRAGYCDMDRMARAQIFDEKKAPSQKVPRMNEKEEILALENAWAQAFIRNDASAIGRHMAEDWTIITPEGNQLDRSTFLGLIESGDLTHDGMDFEDTTVRMYGNMAIVSARATSKGRFKGHPFIESERSTDVFVKVGGQWQCVLTHLTRIGKR